MIVVHVVLHSAVTSTSEELARMMINNIGGDYKQRDYEVRTYRGRNKHALNESMKKDITTRKGKVLKHHSNDVHIWHLVAKALKAMEYGTQ